MAAGRGAGRSLMAGGGAGGDRAGGDLPGLYRWLDAVPLSRPRRNIARDFSDGVLAAEVVKFFFPAMVQLHSYVPTSSTAQKLTNWGHLNRKVLRRLEVSLPEGLVREVVQSKPGAVEQVLLLLRQKIQEKQEQKHNKEPGIPAALEESGYLETGRAGVGGQASPLRVTKGPQGGVQAPAGDPSSRWQLEERERALLRAQETIQILQLKVGRLEQLLHLKNVRIDDLSRRLRGAQGHQP